MAWEAIDWKKSQPLAEAYIQGAEQVQPLFPHHFARETDWNRRAQQLSAFSGPAADRAALVEALAAYNERVGNAPQALGALAQLRRADALAVVGGQQAGLFGGPLLVLYKAVTLLQLAREWSERLDRPVVPVFWIAGEDHDFDEVNHVMVLSPAQQVEKIKVEHPTGQRTSVSRLPLSAAAWSEALEVLERSLPDTEFKGPLLAKLRASAAGAPTLSEAFGRWMAGLFGEYGLVLLDSDDAALRRVEAPFFSELIARNAELSEALAEGRAAVEAAGFTPQAEVTADGANLFVFHADQRLLLQRDGDGFTDKKKELRLTRAELLELAAHNPDRLSNNVMTRPLMQQFLFPVLATVLGPGEIAYWGLTGPAFERLGLSMPIIAPRLEFTLLEGTVQKHMHKYELSFDDVLQRFDEKKRQWLDAQDTLRLPERFAAVKTAFRAEYEPLVDSLAAINPGVKKLGETNLHKIIEQIDFLAAKAADAHQTQFDAALRQLDRIRLTVLPLAKPQERVYNGCAYLNRYGRGWLQQLVEQRIPVDGQHRVYYL